ncbi:MAG: heparinase II/III family protein [Candidatus Sumerlaeota bacterium]|nr:heparinase II/III family protein [Candidatus Sumerlaeota bacterium]
MKFKFQSMSWNLLKAAAAAFTLITLMAPGLGFSAPPTAAGPLEGGVDPQRIQQIAAMLDEQPFAFGPKIADRDGWKRLAANKAYANVVKDAEKAAASPMPEMTEEIYMQFKQTGRRTSEYAKCRSARYKTVPQYTHAECIENKGRFLKPLEAAMRSICQEKTWIYNFHDPNLDDYHGKKITIDLSSNDIAANLAASLYLLGDRLSAETRQMVTAKLRERIFDPYHKAVDGTGMRLWWITADMNWNSVCHAGVVAAALAACPDRNERAFFVAAAEKYSKDFLRGFGGDGYCAEGMGYWNYGFGNYIQLCETVFQATHGKLDLYNLEGARETALYPVRIRLINNIAPAYADSGVNPKPGMQLMSYINRRYELGLKDFVVPDFATAGGGLVSSLMYSCPNSATSRPQAADKEFYELHTLFEHGGVLNCRPLPGSPCRMAVSFKGGHNAEPHNHNDLGSFLVTLGNETLILDPGGEIYTARTFSKDRYKSNLLNSWGHPVPVIAGKLQKTGASAKAVIVAKNFTEQADTYAMDISSAYETPGIQTLKRTFVYSRAGEGTLTVTDDFAFTSPQTFGSALITYGQWKQLSDRELLISSKKETVKVAIETGGVPFKVSSETIKEEAHGKTLPTRIGINLSSPQVKGKVVFTITPAKQN